MKTNKIAVLCPSRDRVKNVQECIKSWELNNSQFSDFFVVCDSDQQTMYEVFNNLIISPKTGRRGMNDPTNYASKILCKKYKYVMFVGDDHRFRSKDWDTSFINEYESNIKYGFVYGNDLLQGSNLPTACCVSSDIIELLGYISYPQLLHLYVDNYWVQLGRRLNKISYLNNIIIEHMHPAAGKAINDQAYEEVNNSYVNNHDRKVFEEINFEQELKKLEKLNEI